MVIFIRRRRHGDLLDALARHDQGQDADLPKLLQQRHVLPARHDPTRGRERSLPRRDPRARRTDLQDRGRVPVVRCLRGDDRQCRRVPERWGAEDVAPRERRRDGRHTVVVRPVSARTGQVSTAGDAADDTARRRRECQVRSVVVLSMGWSSIHAKQELFLIKV